MNSVFLHGRHAACGLAPPIDSPRVRVFRPRRARRTLALTALLIATSAIGVARAGLADQEQAAFQAAAAHVAPSVVQIRTVGGLDQAAGQALAQGPATGVVATADGYVVSSLFHFAGQPSSILILDQDGRQHPAQIVGRDQSRMLALLKVDDEVRWTPAEPAASDGVRPGQWVVAVGRTWRADAVDVSVGVISAVGRMQGRAVQTDASVSPANYGGPLVDLSGRVVGVLAPLAPDQAGAAETDELAGSEFYDSGIGFAVPWAPLLERLPRWIEALTLRRGLLGVGFVEGFPHGTPARIATVWPRSPAAAAGLGPGDEIVAVDGVPVATQTQSRRQIAPRYAGDRLRLTLRRHDDADAATRDVELELAAEMPRLRPGFLGVWPAEQSAASPDAASAQRSPPQKQKAPPAAAAKTDPGILLRGVWPGSPAALAGLEAGARLVQLDGQPTNAPAEAAALLDAVGPGNKIEAKIAFDDGERTVAIELAELPHEAGQLDAAALAARTAPSGEMTLEIQDEWKLAEFPNSCTVCRPAAETAGRPLVLWLGEGSSDARQGLAALWRDSQCSATLLAPAPTANTGWASEDLEYLRQLLRQAQRRFVSDPARVVAGGEGKGGQLAWALGLRGAPLAGLATIDAPLPRTLTLPSLPPGKRLAVLAWESSGTFASPLLRDDRRRLREAGYPVTELPLPPAAETTAPLPPTALPALQQWVTTLDRF